MLPHEWMASGKQLLRTAVQDSWIKKAGMMKAYSLRELMTKERLRRLLEDYFNEFKITSASDRSVAF